MTRCWRLFALAWCTTLLVVTAARSVLAQAVERDAEPSVGAVPRLAPPPDFSEYVGRRIERVDVQVESDLWRDSVSVTRIRAGEILTPESARRALRELTDSGRFATATAYAEATPSGQVVLTLRVLPRRIVDAIRVTGDVLDEERTREHSGVRVDGEITSPGLAAASKRVTDHYARHGYPGASVRAQATETDDPMRVVVSIDIIPGPSARVTHRRFEVSPSPDVPGLRPLLSNYGVANGDRIDEDALMDSDRALEKLLRSKGWHRASVSHRADLAASGGVVVRVSVSAGPLIRLRFEGNQQLDATQLIAALDLDATEDKSPASLVEQIRETYVKRGFFDVEVRAIEIGAPTSPVHDLVFTIRERAKVNIVGREYPCLTGPRSAAEVGSELDSFLSEELPGGQLFGAVNPRAIDSTLGPRGTSGNRAVPPELNPWMTYAPDVYERAMQHVQDLYRSEGYLSASVGPAQLLRRRCHLRSPPGQCLPIGQRIRPRTACTYDEIGLPMEEPPPDAASSCVADPARHAQCEPNAVLHIPIKLGPRTFLYDLDFEGNRVLVEDELREVAALALGQPVSQTELENATRRVLEAYAEEGFAFADAEVELEFSPDRTRARARFIISEREQVRISGIIIQGARRTREGLIRSRVALEVGQLYRRSDVRKTEERLATLGVFSSVTVGLDEPYVPARRKQVVINVVERMPQYLDVRPGFSTGEGLRITFEYGHRNLAGEAIPLTLRVQLGYLPEALILQEDVRRKLADLDGLERLERRNTATIEFPEIGLGPLFRLSVEGVDVRDIARDFALTKDAGIVTLTYRPERRISLQLGGSVELNDARIHDEDAEKSRFFRTAFRVPEGKSTAIAQRVGVSWDRRDNPLEATSGTLVSGGVEHVRSVDADGEITGRFLHYTSTLGGYVRLNDSGLAVAVNLGWGYNQQIRDGSVTYPDRLFFMGGIDSLRGFLQDSVIPEDIADDVASGRLPIEEVLIRGGDVFINPRVELRIPLGDTVRTALFADAGNLWAKPEKLDPTVLRYSIGSGLRISTPIGPLVFDYGLNVERVLDALDLTPEEGRRFWEEFGAFHFSVGLF